ncbi:CFF_HP2_G0009640.mRNA.1.CDS.1 [Saccharomyces cerevisiae]|nr:CFF_HP2_G0009640.mRNA.1.CDS.1 [Saccharomyces cerevisiae]CAI6418830.1 CFF_HP2_G0009640.mRNA.1.CDS.1 [Saccharomyces cerevisiae]
MIAKNCGPAGNRYNAMESVLSSTKSDYNFKISFLKPVTNSHAEMLENYETVLVPLVVKGDPRSRKDVINTKICDHNLA